jgi:tRNA pseudouridine38-40 synthase
MVRNLVGTLVWVGVGRRPASWVADVLAARDRAAAAPTFDPCGLYLTRVEYDPAFEVPRTPDLMPTWTA